MLSYFELRNKIYNYLDILSIPRTCFDRMWFEFKYDVTETDATIWYHEPGRDSTNIVCRSKKEDEIVYEVLKIIISEQSYNYAAKNRTFGQDYRRVAFSLQLEWFNKISADFYERRATEIEKILIESPYDD